MPEPACLPAPPRRAVRQYHFANSIKYSIHASANSADRLVADTKNGGKCAENPSRCGAEREHSADMCTILGEGIYKRFSQMTKANGQLLFNNMRKTPFYKEELLVVAFSSVSCFRFPHRTSPTCLLIQLGLYPSPGRGGVCAGCGSADSMVRRKVITQPSPAQPSPAFISCARVRTQ